MNKYLFIGGPADGTWYETKEEPYWLVAQRSTDNTDPNICIKYCRYRKEIIALNRKTYISFYVFEDTSLEEAFIRLLKFYKPEKDKQ